MRNLLRGVGTGVVGAMVCGAVSIAGAHGGGNPSPWPGVPVPVPAGPGRPAPGAPQGSGGATSTPQQTRDALERWTGWWYYNQWRYHPAADLPAVTGGSDAARLVDTSTVGMLRGLFRHVLVHDAHDEPRSAAALASGKAKDLEAREGLEKVALDESAPSNVRRSAALALGMAGSVPSAGLLARLAEEGKHPVDVRVHAVAALGLLGDPSATQTLLRVFAKASEKDLRVAAGIALGLAGGPEAARALAETLRRKDEMPAVRAVAATALGKIGPGPVGDATVERLLRDALLLDPEEQVRRSAALVLRLHEGPETVDACLRAATSDKDRVVPGFALLTLGELAGRLGGPRAEAARACIERACKDPESVTVGFAAVALGLLARGDGHGAAPLRAMLAGDGSISNRSAAAIGLGLAADAEGKALLLAEIRKATSPELRGYACEALGLYGQRDPAVVEALRTMVATETDPAFRSAAAMSLAMLGDRAAAPKLLPLLESKSAFDRMSGMLTLARLRDLAVAANPILARYWAEKDDPQVRALAVVALGHLAEQHDPPVLRRLTFDFNHLVICTTTPSLQALLRLF